MIELLDLYPLFSLSKTASLSIAQVSLISTSIYMHMARLSLPLHIRCMNIGGSAKLTCYTGAFSHHKRISEHENVYGKDMQLFVYRAETLATCSVQGVARGSISTSVCLPRKPSLIARYFGLYYAWGPPVTLYCSRAPSLPWKPRFTGLPKLLTQPPL
ncbi:hypothetical protein ASPVEDRAFT_616213 [Aspergillus versicolor CBS 583.65]|uniref:Uncharacterized protein n=1 Tax=Aspergillus versicolor CBS 583.65 TaxID=1036611 RepID=A0A1L9PI21_ASPVE|nr:uncharacterized protein ASPVEDRAFT_616213 [Aspergillus versicolor CBS 583.65]OJJ01095.1 hypothetical protein ASPVEDRAFT_616213 [Aspergillus versicolor CBS 583.65]